MQHCHTINQLLEAAQESIIDVSCPAFKFYQEFTPEVLRRRYYEKGESFFSFQYERRLTDGSVRWVLNEVRFLVDPASRHLDVILSALDIDAKKREELDVYLSAKMDRMTMLLNRDTTTSLIRNVLTNEPDSTHVLFMLDLDNFKNLNDRMGHQVGDEFLVRMATKLKGCFRESDIVGRIGGDEFFVLMRNLPNLTVAKNKARQLLNVFRELCADYKELDLSCSIGASAYPENGATLDELYSAADDALYRAKHHGKNCCVSTF
jgi:diguanylate cyclase (GGDEF)-like protein